MIRNFVPENQHITSQVTLREKRSELQEKNTIQKVWLSAQAYPHKWQVNCTFHPHQLGYRKNKYNSTDLPIIIYHHTYLGVFGKCARLAPSPCDQFLHETSSTCTSLACHAVEFLASQVAQTILYFMKPPSCPLQRNDKQEQVSNALITSCIVIYTWDQKDIVGFLDSSCWGPGIILMLACSPRTATEKIHDTSSTRKALASMPPKGSNMISERVLRVCITWQDYMLQTSMWAKNG